MGGWGYDTLKMHVTQYQTTTPRLMLQCNPPPLPFNPTPHQAARIALQVAAAAAAADEGPSEHDPERFVAETGVAGAIKFQPSGERCTVSHAAAAAAAAAADYDAVAAAAAGDNDDGRFSAGCGVELLGEFFGWLISLFPRPTCFPSTRAPFHPPSPPTTPAAKRQRSDAKPSSGPKPAAAAPARGVFAAEEEEEEEAAAAGAGGSSEQHRAATGAGAAMEVDHGGAAAAGGGAKGVRRRNLRTTRVADDE